MGDNQISFSSLQCVIYLLIVATICLSSVICSCNDVMVCFCSFIAATKSGITSVYDKLKYSVSSSLPANFVNATASGNTACTS